MTPFFAPVERAGREPRHPVMRATNLADFVATALFLRQWLVLIESRKDSAMVRDLADDGVSRDFTKVEGAT